MAGFLVQWTVDDTDFIPPKERRPGNLGPGALTESDTLGHCGNI
jgi:hypothetical protein